MGYSAQVQQSPNQSSGKGSFMDGGNSGQAGTGYNPMANSPEYNPTGGAPHQAMGKGGAITNSATSGQPRMGQPNLYPNTVGQTGGLSQLNQMGGGGKGKSGGLASAQQSPQQQFVQGQPMYDEGLGMNPNMRNQGPVGPAGLG